MIGVNRNLVDTNESKRSSLPFESTQVLLTISLIAGLELISNNMLEPLLYGSSTGISAVALIFAALLGTRGLFLSAPLTVWLLVVGKNVPSMSFLNVILGTNPVLAPEAQFYQRMLAMDADSMLELADRHLRFQQPD